MMKPIEFITSIGDEYNACVGEIMDAVMNKQLKILSPSEEWVVVGYYYSEENECMCLDIVLKSEKKRKKK